jgi:transcriptional regulator with XRE-family HTH domain
MNIRFATSFPKYITYTPLCQYYNPIQIFCLSALVLYNNEGGDYMDYKRLGLRIREERTRLGLTQAALAEAIDISDTYMGAIERGERSLTLDTLVRLVGRLGVTVDYMLADSVSDSDPNILAQFRQITDGQPLARKQMAINVLRTVFAYFKGEGG